MFWEICSGNVVASVLFCVVFCVTNAADVGATDSVVRDVTESVEL